MKIREVVERILLKNLGRDMTFHEPFLFKLM